MKWLQDLSLVFARLGRTLGAGLFLRVGPCHFDFEIERDVTSPQKKADASGMVRGGVPH
jgi:hypothetical protein